MTVTDEPVVPVTEDVEPRSDEGEAVAVELVRSGWVRLHWNGRTVRLRRPFFGELKLLRLALQDASDAISEQSDGVQTLGEQLMAESAANDEPDESRSDADRRAVRRELTNRSKAAARELTEFSEQQRIAWWRQVVDVIGVDGELPVDDELPSWIVDTMLPNRVLQHWRAVPLARG